MVTMHFAEGKANCSQRTSLVPDLTNFGGLTGDPFVTSAIVSDSRGYTEVSVEGSNFRRADNSLGRPLGFAVPEAPLGCLRFAVRGHRP